MGGTQTMTTMMMMMTMIRMTEGCVCWEGRGGGLADRDEVPLALILVGDVGQQVLRLLRLPFKARRRHLI